MSHVLFEIDRKADIDEKEKSQVAYLRDKLSTAEVLGLKAQVRSLKADIATIERGGLIATSALSDAELKIWRAWLPTAYSDVTSIQGEHLSNYNFDRIPEPVLKVWEKHKKSDLFERFEIWTPEHHALDPILMGVNGNARHLLARWGESDANLISFDDIKRELSRRWFAGEWMGRNESYEERDARSDLSADAFFGAVFSTMAVMFVVSIPLMLLTRSPAIMLLGSVVISASAGVYIFRRLRKKKTEHALQISTLMQAIAQDDATRRELNPSSA